MKYINHIVWGTLAIINAVPVILQVSDPLFPLWAHALLAMWFCFVWGRNTRKNDELVGEK